MHWHDFYCSKELESSQGVLDVLHIDGHEPRHEGLQVVDGLVSFVQPVLIKRRNLAEFGFQFSVTVLGQLSLKPLEYDLNTKAYW